MPESFGDLRRNIVAFLSSLRYSVDRPHRLRSLQDSEDRERLARSIVKIEEARVRFNVHFRYGEELKSTDWKKLRQDLLDFVNEFIHSPEIDPEIFQYRFVLGPTPARERDKPSSFIGEFISARDPIRVADALLIFQKYLEDSKSIFPSQQATLSFDDLERIVPDQQIAPVQFDIKDSRIVISHRPPKVSNEDRSNIKAAFEHIKQSGERLINSLEKSNCDRRLLDSVKELQNQLCSESNIVKLGLMNIACGLMSTQFQPELPAAIVGMFSAHSASISLYVAQFPEWEQFTKKAASIDLDDDDIADIKNASTEVISVLVKNPSIVDSDVPKTISLVSQFLSFPASSSKRAALAILKTLENLVSVIIRHCISFIGKTAEKTVESASTVASKVIVGLLGIALVSATGIGSAAYRTGAPWVQQAAEIVQRHIDKVLE